MTTLFDKPVEVVAPVETISTGDMPPLESFYDSAPFYQVTGIEILTKEQFNEERCFTLISEIPDFDSELLSDIVYWAYLDSMGEQAQDRFADWGSWYQGDWARRLPMEDATRDPSGFVVYQPQTYRGPECESAFCIAGQVAAQRNMMLLSSGGFSADKCAPRIKEDGKVRADMTQVESIPQFARTALGLTFHEGNLLFNGGNEIKDVVSISCWIARRRGRALFLPQEVLDLDVHGTDANLKHTGFHGTFVCEYDGCCDDGCDGDGAHCAPEEQYGSLTEEALV